MRGNNDSNEAGEQEMGWTFFSKRFYNISYQMAMCMGHVTVKGVTSNNKVTENYHLILQLSSAQQNFILRLSSFF